MAAKKYQVFVSSTFRDLVDERQDAIRNILDLNHIPAGMELFPATDVQQLDYIKKVIDECDYYVLIIGGRYGSMDEAGISYTEREYDYAVETGKVVLAFVHDDPASITVGKSDIKPEIVRALNSFREKVMTGRLVKTWSNRQNLEPLVLKALMHVFNDLPQVGWIRGNTAASEPLLAQTNQALQENAALKTELAKLKVSQPIQIADIADLDDHFEVRYKYSTFTSRDGTRYYTDSEKLTWRQIFLPLAGKLEKAKTAAVIVSAFQEALKEANTKREVSSLDETDKTRIKVQMVALGLIQAQVSKSTAGGIEEFLSLTSKGMSIFMEGMVVRKANGKSV